MYAIRSYYGANINGAVDCEAVKDFASKLDGGVVSATYPFMCADSYNFV